jgi:hypothetical protein
VSAPSFYNITQGSYIKTCGPIGGPEVIDALCDILAQDLIGLIEYSYHQGIPSFLKVHLQRTPELSVLGLEQFQDG